MVVMLLDVVSASASMLAGVLFLEWWRDTDDRLFLWLALAFWCFAAHWTAVSVISFSAEPWYALYWVRLAGFVLVLIGIVEKHLSVRSG